MSDSTFCQTEEGNARQSSATFILIETYGPAEQDAEPASDQCLRCRQALLLRKPLLGLLSV